MSAVVTKRECERALVAAGLSARQAKKVLARGYRALGEDSHEEIAKLFEIAEALERELLGKSIEPATSIGDNVGSPLDRSG